MDIETEGIEKWENCSGLHKAWCKTNKKENKKDQRKYHPCFVVIDS